MLFLILTLFVGNESNSTCGNAAIFISKINIIQIKWKHDFKYVLLMQQFSDLFDFLNVKDAVRVSIIYRGMSLSTEKRIVAFNFQLNVKCWLIEFYYYFFRFYQIRQLFPHLVNVTTQRKNRSSIKLNVEQQQK